MALNENHLKRQTERLKTLPRGEDRPWGSDKSPGLRDELYRALWNVALSDEHATRIIDSAMEILKFCPPPAELMAIAYQVGEDKPKTRAAKCPICGGTGFLISWWLITDNIRVNKSGEMISGYKRKERIADEETARKLRKSIGRGQEVISAAEMCSCNAAAIAERGRKGAA